MTPTLTHVADLLVEVGEPIAIGETPQGLRRVVPITGGTIRGERLNGTVLAGGADFQIIGPDGFTRLEARYVIRLDDGALVYVDNRGVRFGPPEVMARITRGEPVDPAQVYFRIDAALRDWRARLPVADAALVHRLGRAPSRPGRPFGVRGRLGPGERIERPRCVEKRARFGFSWAAAISRRKPPFRGLEKLGFPWILSCEMSLFNGLRRILAEKNFSRPLAPLRAARGGSARAWGIAEGRNCSWGKPTVFSDFPQQIVASSRPARWRSFALAGTVIAGDQISAPPRSYRPSPRLARQAAFRRRRLNRGRSDVRSRR